MAKEPTTSASRLRPLAKAVLRTQSDDRLVALAREGREAAFEEIVRRYRPGLVAFASAYAPRDRAEDVVQESLVRSWEALGKATEEIHLKPWLYTIVRNRALNARRDAKFHEPLSEEIDGVPQPPELVLSREELASVVGAVGALPEPQRQALVRSALEGHTHEQIAAALGSSPGAVRQLIYRARLNLRTGVGMIIPLPLVRLLAEHGTETAAAGGVAAGGAALGAAGGASLVSKVATVAAIGTLAAGAGVAIERSKSDDKRDGAPVAGQDRDQQPEAATPQAAAVTPASGDSTTDTNVVTTEARSDDRGEDESSGDSGSGSDDSAEVDSSGPSASAGPSDGDGERSGSDGDDNSGPRPPDDDDLPETEDDHSGPGGGGSGHSGSGSGSGSGHSGSGSGPPPEPPEPPDEDHSGSGSGGSGSGSSGSGGDSGHEPPEPPQPPDDD